MNRHSISRSCMFFVAAVMSLAHASFAQYDMMPSTPPVGLIFLPGYEPPEDEIARKAEAEFFMRDAYRESSDAMQRRLAAEAKMNEDRSRIAEIEMGRITRETPRYIPEFYVSPDRQWVTINPDQADYDTPYVPYEVIDRAPAGYWQ